MPFPNFFLGGGIRKYIWELWVVGGGYENIFLSFGGVGKYFAKFLWGTNCEPMPACVHEIKFATSSASFKC